MQPTKNPDTNVSSASILNSVVPQIQLSVSAEGNDSMTRIQRKNEFASWQSVSRVHAIVCLALLSLHVFAFAAVADVIAPVSVVSSEWNESPARAAHMENLIDGSGLSHVGPVESQTHEFHPNAMSMWHAGQPEGGIGDSIGTPPLVNGQVLV